MCCSMYMLVSCIKQSGVHIPRCLLSDVTVLDSLRFVPSMITNVKFSNKSLAYTKQHDAGHILC